MAGAKADLSQMGGGSTDEGSRERQKGNKMHKGIGMCEALAPATHQEYKHSVLHTTTINFFFN